MTSVLARSFWWPPAGWEARRWRRLRSRNSRADRLAAVLQRLTARIDSLEAGLCPAPAALPEPTGNARADSFWPPRELDRRLRALRAQRCAAAAPAARPARPTPPTTWPRSAPPPPRRRAAPPRAGIPAETMPPRPRPPSRRRRATPPPSTPRSAPPATSAWWPARAAARQRRGARVRGRLPVRPRPLLQHQDLPDASRTRRSASRRDTSTGPACPAGCGWTSASSASRSATSTAGTCTRCPKPSIRWSTSASSRRKG